MSVATYRHGTQPRVGVLLVNLGTPDAPDESSVRRYLAEFLSDRRVVEIPQIVWQPILRGLVLRTRPRKSAHAYSQVWTEEGSPLAFHTAAQARALQVRLGDAAIVRHAMRYQKPSMAAELDRLLADGCERILVAPLYPQYSGATTASALDAVANWIKDRRRLSALRTLPPYFDDPLMIAALHQDLAAQIGALDFEPELLVLSFHGMPERTLRLGDPYHCHCMKTARLLAERMKMPLEKLRVVFQSRFGKAEWLQPYTDMTVQALAQRGRSHAQGFADGPQPAHRRSWRQGVAGGAQKNRIQLIETELLGVHQGRGSDQSLLNSVSATYHSRLTDAMGSNGSLFWRGLGSRFRRLRSSGQMGKPLSPRAHQGTPSAANPGEPLIVTQAAVEAASMTSP
jgi:ferrochelatase